MRVYVCKKKKMGRELQQVHIILYNFFLFYLICIFFWKDLGPRTATRCSIFLFFHFHFHFQFIASK